MNKIGFMQGRLCDQVDGKIQAFPWDDWDKEFEIAEKIGIKLLEWTLDQDKLHENPFMTRTGRNLINALSIKHGVKVISLTGDCFMQSPFWKESGDKKSSLISDFMTVVEACEQLSTRTIVVPLVDNGSIETMSQEDNLVKTLLQENERILSAGIKIAFESDYSPVELSRFIDRLPDETFGINYDIGNSAALGYDVSEELKLYSSRILNVHVKDRQLRGRTVALGEGAANFDKVFQNFAKSHYKGNYILQTARAIDGKHANAIDKYMAMTTDLIAKYAT